MNGKDRRNRLTNCSEYSFSAPLVLYDDLLKTYCSKTLRLMALFPTGPSVFHRSLTETLLLADHGPPKVYWSSLLQYKDEGSITDYCFEMRGRFTTARNRLRSTGFFKLLR